jgi:hypothetical protein
VVGKKPEKKPSGRDGPPKGYPKDQSVYADPENWRYPLHTPWHAKAARRYFDDWSNRGKYAEEERTYIDWRINQALEKFGAKAGSATTGKRPAPAAPSRKKVEELSLEHLLRLFLGGLRLQRAKEIDDSLVSVSEQTSSVIAGKVKDYVIRVDIKTRTILHDCQDWRKNLASKNMCKHLGKFLLTMHEGNATSLLRDVLKNKDEWTFSAPETAESSA